MHTICFLFAGKTVKSKKVTNLGVGVVHGIKLQATIPPLLTRYIGRTRIARNRLIKLSQFYRWAGIGFSLTTSTSVTITQALIR
jgi:hypothetical protein